MATPDTSTPNEPVITQQGSLQKPNKSKRGLFILLFFLTAILFATLGAIGYWLMTDDEQDTNSEKETIDENTDQSQDETNTEDESPSGENIVDPYEGWKTFENDFIKFKYPPTWKNTADGYIGFIHQTDDTAAMSESSRILVFQALYYNETGTFICPLSDQKTITVKTKSNTYTGTTYKMKMGAYGQGETDNAPTGCENYTNADANSVHIKVSGVKEAEDDVGFDYKMIPDILFSYKTEDYPSGNDDFLLVMKSFEAK